MKRAKKAAAKKATTDRKPADAPPDKLYRPFEKLAKDGKKKDKAAPPEASKGHESKPAAKTAHQGAAGKAPVSERGHKASPARGAKGDKTVAYASAAAKAAHEKAEQAHSAENSESFAVYMAGVRALDEKGGTRIPRSASRLERAAKGTLPAVDADAPAREQFQALVVEGIRFETSDDGERIEGRRVEVEPREVRRLRRGQYTVDQQIDLHGMSAFEARKAMEAFLEKRRREGDRVLRIIHGKGGHSPRGVSVLRGEIAAWLSQGPAKRHVAAFATAPVEDGGAGALLVLLMRPRA